MQMLIRTRLMMIKHVVIPITIVRRVVIRIMVIHNLMIVIMMIIGMKAIIMIQINTHDTAIVMHQPLQITCSLH